MTRREERVWQFVAAVVMATAFMVVVILVLS
jgi:hypothetical protein